MHPGLRTPFRLASLWLPPVALAALLLSFGGTPDLRFVPDHADDLVVRKVGHAAAYGLLALLVYRALLPPEGRPATPWTAWIGPMALTAAVAITDEWRQTMAAGREGKVSDVLLDLIGALIVLILFRSWRRLQADRAARPSTTRPVRDRA